MTNPTTAGDQVSPRRDAFVSDSGYFFFSVVRQEFGNNLRHPSFPQVARIAMRGMDAFDERVRSCDEEWVPGHVEEIIGDDGEAIGFRVDNPRLLFESLKAYMNLPLNEVTADLRGLAHTAGADFDGFVQDLAIKEIIGRK